MFGVHFVSFLFTFLLNCRLHFRHEAYTKKRVCSYLPLNTCMCTGMCTGAKSIHKFGALFSLSLMSFVRKE